MYKKHKLAIIIPALNEEEALPSVLQDIPDFVDMVLVIDNGSTDNTSWVAKKNNAIVYREDRKGYGWACLKGMAHLSDEDIVIFLDGDYSDHPDELSAVIQPILHGNADMVIGSRVLGEREPGALTPQARFGNWLSCLLIKWFWGYQFTDLGPFRAILRSTLEQLRMKDQNYGWTVEMQIKAAQQKIPVQEVPVKYRKRIGKSKVSGTFKGVIFAGTKILWTIFRAAYFK